MEEEEVTEVEDPPPDPDPPEGSSAAFEPNHVARIRSHFGERFPRIPPLHLDAPREDTERSAEEIDAEIDLALQGEGMPGDAQVAAIKHQKLVADTRNVTYRRWLLSMNPEGFLSGEDGDADA